MKAIERLYKYIDYKGNKPTRFEKELGLSNGYLGTQLKRNADLGESVLNKIIDYCLDINPEWLLTGRGEMIKSDENLIIINNKDKYLDGIPLYNAEASAGFGSFDQMLSEENIIDRYKVPVFKYCDFMMYVKGSSMYPKYSNGDIIACKILHNVHFLQWNKVYVIATTEQGFLVKRVKESDIEDCVCVVSDNKEYPPFDILKNEIVGYALVVGVIRLE